MEYLDPDALAEVRLPEEDYEIPGRGVVRIRGLNRLEAMRVQKADGAEATERLILSYGVVQPHLTDESIKRWQRASVAGEIEGLSTRIAVLSGMAEDSAKEAVRAFEANPEEEFRVLPGAEALDDGGPAPGGDVER